MRTLQKWCLQHAISEFKEEVGPECQEAISLLQGAEVDRKTTIEHIARVQKRINHLSQLIQVVLADKATYEDDD